ncbi:MAG: ROK family protein [Acidobacteria bacterium]|nr:ROK family protein [Acidobacteriota bacterium]
MPDPCVAGIDIGGTKIALAVADLEGRIIEQKRFPARTSERGPHAIIEEALSEIERMLGSAGSRLDAVGIGCGGPLDRARGLILSPPNLPGWDEFPVVQIVEERLGVPALLDNDANAAALGEHRHGAGRGYRHLVYITQSTGIGGGVIVRGELVHGVCDGAGEVGHMTVLPDGPVCGCGGRGCLEALCSGTGIARRARERLAAGASSALSSLSSEEVTARAVAEAARAGDTLASEVWDEMIHYLAVGVGNLFNALAPEAIVIGGGVSEAGEQLFAPLRERVRERARMLPPEKINILQASLGGDSALHGAVILAQAARARRAEPTS